MPRALVGSAARRLGVAAALAAGISAAACSGDSAGAAPAPRAVASDVPAATGFDFWVLSLSWSPSYCAIEGEDANRQQCASRRELGFIVHGLWPQFESGWPEYCESSEPARVPDSLVRDYLDILPSAGLIGHQWRKHGTCSGLTQADYLATTRAARRMIGVPGQFSQPTGDMRVAPDDLEAAFVAANTGMYGSGIAVTCDGGFIEEVRICLTMELGFRSCPEVDSRSCRAVDAEMPEPD